MKTLQKNILQFELSAMSKAGIYIVNMQNEEQEGHDILKPHRDNHFLLMFAISGHFKLNIDFKEVEFSTPTFLCVFPGQVHNIIEAKNPKGWIISFDPTLVDEEIRQLFEIKFHKPILLEQQSDYYLHAVTLLNFIENLQSGIVNKYNAKSIHSLLTALLNLIASNITLLSSIENTNEHRGTTIKDAFNKLLKQHYKTWKKPAQYAFALNVSVGHLNDTVKALTGIPISIHIQQKTILEAKRQLYFTNKSVKEIGYEVGYNEPVYFGKLFKKTTNLTPLEFRQQFRH